MGAMKWTETNGLALSLITSTRVEMALAKKAAALLPSNALATLTLLLAPPADLWPPSRLPQPLLPFRPTSLSSKCTTEVFLTLPSAEPNLTTVSSQSAMELKTARTTTSLRTPGAHLGEIKDLSRLPITEMVMVSAVFRWMLSVQPLTEHDISIIHNDIIMTF